MSTPHADAARFLAARDFLLAHREAYGVAYRDFRWPQLGRFNWAPDYFDAYARGAIRHVITDAEGAAKLEAIPGAYTRLVVGDGAPGWRRSEEAYDASPDLVPGDATLASAPMLLYFTSGTTAHPKLVLHTHESYPVGHLSTMYWIGLREGDVPPGAQGARL